MSRNNVSKRTANKIKPYEDYIFEEYWFNGRSFKDIADELGFVSGVCLYRYMKKYSFVRSHEEQLKDLKESNTGRVRTKEAKENVRKAVQKYYDEGNYDKSRFNGIINVNKKKAEGNLKKIDKKVGGIEEYLKREYTKNRKSLKTIAKEVGSNASYIKSLLIKYDIPIRGRGEGNIGKKYTMPEEQKQKLRYVFSDPEVKKKRSEAQKEVWSKLSYKDRINRTHNGCVAGFNAVLQNTVSSIELKVKSQLDNIGIRYIQQKSVTNGERNFYLDFYIPSLKLVIECNGDYWHNLPERKQRDKELKEYVESTGRKIVFIWEHEIKDEWFWIGDYIEGSD